ncbi:DUF4145 domain-containing protein [Isoptericola sp. QY 916]|uniref:DUF4145 domain-containing protein n=1 Tax=Isoptericola sp. QY 916 TaxID=2782570 RepID=UPI003D2FEBBF|nr:DUF4145 domain-containing protein [Isoptericola sp. QY 916]
MGSVIEDLSVVSSTARHGADDSSYWIELDCRACGRAQHLVIAAAESLDDRRPGFVTLWLRCMSCRQGSVANRGELAPGSTPLGTVGGLPEDIESAWNEVRNCHANGAHTSSVLMCRKILLHVAVERGLPAKDGNGRAPSFEQAVRHLQDKGLISSEMQPWVDQIRKSGNGATHDLTAIEKDMATMIGTFTYLLLQVAYEARATMAKMLGQAPPPHSGS